MPSDRDRQSHPAPGELGEPNSQGHQPGSPPKQEAKSLSVLRWAVVGLLLANLALLVWLQGWARPWGFAPATSSEPWRVQQQIHPEALTLLSAEALASAQLQLARRTLPCWQTGPLDEASTLALEQALQALNPAPLSQSSEVDEPERWMLFMGPYASPTVLERKRAELQALKLNALEVTHPQWGQGLSLGAFESNTQAQQALSELGPRGVRTARVVRDHGSRAGRMVSVWTGDASVRAQLEVLLATARQASIGSSATSTSASTSAPHLNWQSCQAP